MKKITALSILFLGFFLFSCGSDDEMLDEYYVKYVVDGFDRGISTLDVRINSESNDDINFEIGNKTRWEKVIGPVNKGFKASVGVNTNSGPQIIRAEIYVSKNGDPFALKMKDDSSEDRNEVAIEYTIDF